MKTFRMSALLLT